MLEIKINESENAARIIVVGVGGAVYVEGVRNVLLRVPCLQAGLP